MSGPVVAALGHAGLSVGAAGLRLLADPWLSPGGAFLGSWFPFPDNAHLADRSWQDTDVVVISHEHLDHLDLPFLQRLPPSVPIVVPRYPSTVLERRLWRAGRRVVVLDAWERYPLGGDGWLTVIPEPCPMSHDAAVLVAVGGRVLLHTNDARISLSQVRRAVAEAGEIDVMAVQMSGASWHPVRYDYPPDRMAEISEAKRVGKFKAVTRLVRSVRPRLVMPYAGPPCFLDDDLFELNGGLHGAGIFPDQDEAVTWLRTRLPDQPSTYLLPGDEIGLTDLSVRRDPHWSGFALDAPVEARRHYLREYADLRAPDLARLKAGFEEPPADSGLAGRFASHLESLGELSAYFLARIGLLVRFEVLGPAGGVWDAHIVPEGVLVDLDGADGSADYTITVEARWLAAVVDGRVRWEERSSTSTVSVCASIATARTRERTCPRPASSSTGDCAAGAQLRVRPGHRRVCQRALRPAGRRRVLDGSPQLSGRV